MLRAQIWAARYLSMKLGTWWRAECDINTGLLHNLGTTAIGAISSLNDVCSSIGVSAINAAGYIVFALHRATQSSYLTNSHTLYYLKLRPYNASNTYESTDTVPPREES